MTIKCAQFFLKVKSDYLINKQISMMRLAIIKPNEQLVFV
jgi:hypothetical protein